VLPTTEPSAPDESEWHGWQLVDGPSLHIGPVPGRRSIGLFVIVGSTLTPLAYFTSEDHARAALDLLTTMIETSDLTEGDGGPF